MPKYGNCFCCMCIVWNYGGAVAYTHGEDFFIVIGREANEPVKFGVFPG